MTTTSEIKMTLEIMMTLIAEKTSKTFLKMLESSSTHLARILGKFILGRLGRVRF